MGKASKDRRDIFYRKAKEEGWRARSAFKLLQIDEVFGIFAGVRHAVDLCAAPGSWSQVLSRKLYLPALAAGDPSPPRIVSVDLQPMAPIEGVTQLQGDITSEATARAVIDCFAGLQAQLVVCDGAPDVTGLHDLDQHVQLQLILAALAVVTAVLAPGGTFVAKIFRGKDIDLLYSQLRIFFGEARAGWPWPGLGAGPGAAAAQVFCAKPRSSRSSSIEAFVVCRHFALPPGFEPSALRALLAGAAEEHGAAAAAQDADPIMRAAVPFLACGDLSGWDHADTERSYALEPQTVSLEPVQPPTAPAYRAALARSRAAQQAGRGQGITGGAGAAAAAAAGPAAAIVAAAAAST